MWEQAMAYKVHNKSDVGRQEELKRRRRGGRGIIIIIIIIMMVFVPEYCVCGI
jgi:hypothetical protein